MIRNRDFAMPYAGVVKPMAPGECIAYYEGQQGMNYSVINGCVPGVIVLTM
jgi:hypothetical protein